LAFWLHQLLNIGSSWSAVSYTSIADRISPVGGCYEVQVLGKDAGITFVNAEVVAIWLWLFNILWQLLHVQL
jgi:hypothetical protein